jgi:hypothetical protein
MGDEWIARYRLNPQQTLISCLTAAISGSFRIHRSSFLDSRRESVERRTHA